MVFFAILCILFYGILRQGPFTWLLKGSWNRKSLRMPGSGIFTLFLNFKDCFAIGLAGIHQCSVLLGLPDISIFGVQCLKGWLYKRRSLVLKQNKILITLIFKICLSHILWASYPVNETGPKFPSSRNGVSRQNAWTYQILDLERILWVSGVSTLEMSFFLQCGEV